MSVIIRLQNLPWSANALDIRGFFRGLSILDGGVNIVGGEMGDAFIAFSSDEDARQAMMMDGGKIKEVGVRLSLSSRTEMQKVIEVARQSTAAFAPIAAAPAPAPIVPAAAPQVAPPVVETPAIVSGASLASPLSNLLTQQMLQQMAKQQAQLAAGKTLLVGEIAQQLSPMLQQQQQQQQHFPMMQNQLHKDPRRSMEMAEMGNKDIHRRSLESVTSSDRVEGQEREKERDRRGRDRRSRSRERRRSRSRERSSRRRKERSRSRERRGDRRRRRTNSREDHERSSKERDRRDRHRDDAKPGGAVFTAAPQIWDIPPNIPNASQTMISPSVVPEVKVNQKRSLSPEERANLMKLNDKRDSSAFQGNSWKGRNSGGDKEGGRCVKIYGMDPITGYGEIRRFFYGLSINTDGIKMINDRHGKRVGMAYIEFMRSETRSVALARNGMMLKDRKVRISEITQEEFDKEVDSFRPTFSRNSHADRVFQELDEMQNDSNKATRCLRVSNLPSHATQQDVIKMYSNFSLDEIVMLQESPRIYTAYVRFFRMDDTRLAYNLPAGHFHFRNLEISLCDEDKFHRILMKHGVGQNSVDDERSQESVDDVNLNDSRESDALYVVEDERSNEVYEVQDDEALCENDVSMDIVSQDSNEECSSAFRRQEDPRLLRTSDNIQSTFFNQSSLDPRLNRSSAASESRDPRLSMSKKRSDCVVMSNLEPKITDRDVVDFFSDIGLIPLRVHILLNTMGSPSGDCFVEFSSTDDADKALTKNKQHLGNNEMTVELIARDKVDEILNSFDESSPPFEAELADEMPPQMFPMRGAFGMQPPMMRMRGPFPPRMPMGPNGGPPLGPFARPPFGMRMNGNGGGPAMMGMIVPRSVVNIENLPYRAKCDDILEFFGDFELTPADIIRRFNDKGQPTGDARVRFRTPGEAMRAVDTRNQKRIMGRPVYLKVLDN
ncbi:uncharacterized protein LOC132259076 [Phlebotomus argentipes]|uniref:uncharacterized protein LOC132259076 n=1 Tax=Phlebotomus argentipes TaxID=94469 RepID=UPI00289377B5|nr:uncharacterized protein LOC132259076 [Phlebotomus argentipes]